MNLGYKHSFHLIGSKDSNIPKSAQYLLRSNIGGVNRPLLNMKFAVNSIDQLLNVLNQHTQGYADLKQKSQQQGQQQNNQKSGSHLWSSEYIVKLLNMKNDASDLLDGNFRIGMGGAHRHFTFSRLVIQQLVHGMILITV